MYKLKMEVQQNNSVIPILLKILFPYRLLQNIE